MPDDRRRIQKKMAVGQIFVEDTTIEINLW
jgi:hypothetical protein